MKPSLKEEKKLWKKGYKNVVCLDEVGRGPLAGPVMAAAVLFKRPVLNSGSPLLQTLKIQDSKKLTQKKRENLYKIFIAHPTLKWGIGRISEKVVDKINILEATKLAMKKAIERLENKNQRLKIDFLILDGKIKLDLLLPQKSIVKADEKVFSCAVASIIAKVSRDRIMDGYHLKYPKYGFNLHKGYLTKLHFKMLKKYGPCKIHRRTFRPLAKLKKKK